MLGLNRYIKIVVSGTLFKLILTIIHVTKYNIQLVLWKKWDQKMAPGRHYIEARREICPVRLDADQLNFSGISTEQAKELWCMYQQHRFDLLGSGWVYSDYTHSVSGIAGIQYESIKLNPDGKGDFLKHVMKKEHLRRARQIYKNISGDYNPIDWQKDFKSGYRWGAERWFRPQEVAQQAGGDIKVPWELSRLQHLPRLAILGQIFPSEQEKIYREFRNQLLDFIAQNPVRMGVNHMCTMDVGIRAANIALACSLWKNFNVKFDYEFEYIVTEYLFQECDFIRKNLEWSYYLTSNHYFADIAGLLWGSSVLPKCKKRKKWLKFARKQLISEIKKQFHGEGSNGEGSTAYHRLTTEMALYSVALLHYLSKTEDISDATEECYQILSGAGDFINDLTRPDGMFTQIGDNDSGLFFRLSITGDLVDVAHIHAKYQSLDSWKPLRWDKIYLDENMNDGRTLVSSTFGMFGQTRMRYAAQCYPLECSIVKGLLLGEEIKCKKDGRQKNVTLQNQRDKLQYTKTYEIRFDSGNITDGLIRIDYPEFGVYIFRSYNLYLCFNASDNGQKGNAGHAHNDKMSFELFLGNKCIFEDPGTYVYTSFPELRNKYRSTHVHNTVFCGEEQNRFNGLFSMENDTKCSVLLLEENCIEAQVEYRGIVHRRKVDIRYDRVCVTDYCNKNFEQQFKKNTITRGYGKLER